MSRIGKKPIPLPSGIEVAIEGSRVAVTGPKGKLSATFHPDMTVSLEDHVLVVSRPSDEKMHKALHGLTRALLANMVQGVSQGFQKSLEIVGVGYRAQNVGEKLRLQLGLSYNPEVTPPPGIRLQAEGTNRIHVIGADRQQVGQVAATIRALRPPDAYKGKGIRYVGEQVKLKPGKGAGRSTSVA